jgi:hypothetical protein
MEPKNESGQSEVQGDSSPAGSEYLKEASKAVGTKAPPKKDTAGHSLPKKDVAGQSEVRGEGVPTGPQEADGVAGQVARMSPPPKKFTAPTRSGRDTEFLCDGMPAGTEYAVGGGKTEFLCDAMPAGTEYADGAGKTEFLCDAMPAGTEYADGARKADGPGGLSPQVSEFAHFSGQATMETVTVDGGESGFLQSRDGKTDIQDNGFRPGTTEVQCNDVMPSGEYAEGTAIEIQCCGIPAGQEYVAEAASVRGRGLWQRRATVFGVIVIAVLGVIAVLNMAPGDDAPVTPQGDEVVPPSTERDKDEPQQNEQRPDSEPVDQGPANQPEENLQQGSSNGEPNIAPRDSAEKDTQKPTEEKPQEPDVEKPTEKDIEKPTYKEFEKPTEKVEP